MYQRKTAPFWKHFYYFIQWEKWSHHKKSSSISVFIHIYFLSLFLFFSKFYLRREITLSWNLSNNVVLILIKCFRYFAVPISTYHYVGTRSGYLTHLLSNKCINNLCLIFDPLILYECSTFSAGIYLCMIKLTYKSLLAICNNTFWVTAVLFC